MGCITSSKASDSDCEEKKAKKESKKKSKKEKEEKSSKKDSITLTYDNKDDKKGSKQESIDESQFMKVVAMHDYDKRTDNDMSFKFGEILLIIDQKDFDWWSAYNPATKKKGYIPSNYVRPYEEISKNNKSMVNMPFFHSNITRQEAEQLISLSERPGSFLVRTSDNPSAPYTLSAMDQDRNIRHYRIKYNMSEGYRISPSNIFPNLSDLIDYYRTARDSTVIPLIHVIERSQPTVQGLGKDIWEIDPTQIEFEERLGAGNFGEVYKAIFNGTVVVAVKTFKEGKMDPSEFLFEANIMKKICHPRLCKLLAVCTIARPLMIVIEFMESGSLKSYLPKRKHAVAYGVLVSMCLQVCEGMTYLESKNMVHRDLAARNVLISSDKGCKIADFGMAMLTNEKGIANPSNTKVPVRWTAPEAIKSGIFSNKSDVWAYGVVVWEIMTYCEHSPYTNMDNKAVLPHILAGNTLTKPDILSEELYAIAKSCWNLTPAERPSFAEVLIKVQTENQKLAGAPGLYNEL